MYISINRALRKLHYDIPFQQPFCILSHRLHGMGHFFDAHPASDGPAPFFILDVHVVVMANYSRELPKRRSNRHE